MPKKTARPLAIDILENWMAENRYNAMEFGAEVGLSRPSMSRILNNERRPGFDAMTRIKKFTKGAVDYEHWAVKN